MLQLEFGVSDENTSFSVGVELPILGVVLTIRPQARHQFMLVQIAHHYHTLLSHYRKIADFSASSSISSPISFTSTKGSASPEICEKYVCTHSEISV